ncbi:MULTISPECIES: hypothetical protein [unclassified Enterococcus]|uniref:hypothetical protein n=1 Tax=unclassified Enterococcus TaxID=2608891 RepID=UPI001553EA67|nr:MULTISPECIES: hypothetical protein [unclassified Enterococcus]MBS7576338.1 hypothetical protein [Enterococcus sp. MMGLQ5-2]MBS7583570.1 hypothetical protein [Enterococcus sp. MMGLQ5-1]NPD11432.1 hypothetical protein [Enterococcus sp. MMGLQ5-1]NPD36176.1 hypothetical protein [Enterococcus sp. MMGLQ5-2]
MNYELVTVIKPNNPIWAKQKERLKHSDGQVLSISPSPCFNRLKQIEGIKGINLLDNITKRAHIPNQFLFFNQIPTVTGSEIYMNTDRSISIISEGEEIGSVITYAGTRRHVKEVRYINPDQSLDFIEEYSDDGSLYSNIFYYNNKVQEIDFLNTQKFPVVSYYFYENVITLIAVKNPITLEVEHKYNNLNQFVSDQLAKLVTEHDQISISFLGIELMALEHTQSTNTLYLEESPLNEAGEIKGNLLSILTNQVQFVHKVVVNEANYAILKSKNVPLDKVVINNG